MKQIALLVVTFGLCNIASAGIIAYNDPAVVGNQKFNGSLGMDFNVLSGIQITALGAFDSGQDGFSGPITIEIFNRDTQAVVTGAAQIFSGNTTATAGTLTAGDRFFILSTPISLLAGFHGRLVAFGYGAGGDLDGNRGVGTFTNTTDTGGGLISFVGTGEFGSQNVYPNSTDGGPVNRYGAGTFQFQAISTVPEPATMALLGSALLGLFFSGRRRKAL